MYATIKLIACAYQLSSLELVFFSPDLRHIYNQRGADAQVAFSPPTCPLLEGEAICVFLFFFFFNREIPVSPVEAGHFAIVLEHISPQPLPRLLGL